MMVATVDACFARHALDDRTDPAAGKIAWLQLDGDARVNRDEKTTGRIEQSS